MEFDWATLAPPVVIFLATLVRSTFGFGEALLAVPVLALMMPVEVAVPAAVLVSITVALIIVVQDWHSIHLRSAGWLVGSTMLGIPLGLAVLKQVPEPIVKMLLAVVIVAFAAHALLGRQGRELTDDRLAPVFGFAAGVLGGAYGMNGPPLVLYGSLRRWTPVRFRATLQAYFLPAGIAGLAGYWVAGLWTAPVNHLYVTALPGVVLATLAGRALNRRLHPGRFIVYIHVALIGIAALLLWQALS